MARNSKHFIYDMVDFESTHGYTTKFSNFLSRVAFQEHHSSFIIYAPVHMNSDSTRSAFFRPFVVEFLSRFKGRRLGLGYCKSTHFDNQISKCLLSNFMCLLQLNWPGLNICHPCFITSWNSQNRMHTSSWGREFWDPPLWPSIFRKNLEQALRF